MDQPPELSTEAVSVWDRPVVLFPIFILIALFGGLFGSFSLTANLLVLTVGGALVWLGMSGRVVKRPPLRRLPSGTVWWLLPVLMLALVELYAFTRHSIDDYPTLSLLADPVLEHYVPRTALYFGWLCGFWGLVRR